MKQVIVPETQLADFCTLQAQLEPFGFQLSAWSDQQKISLYYSENQPAFSLCFWNQQTPAWLKEVGSILPSLPTVVILNETQSEKLPDDLLPTDILFSPINIKHCLLRFRLLIQKQEQTELLPNHFPSMFQKHSAVMLLINPEDGQIVDANLAASHFYGYPPYLLKQKKISEINTLKPQELQQILYNVAKEKRNTEKEQRNSFEFEHRLASGEIRNVEVHSTPMILEGKKRLFSVISDITARIKAQQELLKSEARYREIFEASEQGICLIDDAGLILFANPKLLAILEIEELGQIIGCSASSFLIEEDLSQKSEMLTHLPQKRKILQDFKLQTSRGNQRWVSLSVTPLYDEKQLSNSSLIMATDITERKCWEQTTQKTLHEREVLLQEIHHRVKNNFQLIISLLRMQVRKTELPEVKASLKKSQNRIRTMALIHEQLYLSKDIAQVNFDEYLRILTRELHQSYRQESGTCALRLKLESLYLKLDQAIPCSLLVHELLSNAFKYAFTNKQKDAEVCICLYQQAGRVHLEIHDNGKGFDFNENQQFTSLGLQLVKQLSEQVNAELSCENHQGTHWKISFDLEEAQDPQENQLM